MALSKLEQETIISFNELESEAHIFTYNKTWQKHLESQLGLKPIYTTKDGAREYVVSKLRILLPKASRQRLIEARKKRQAKLSKMRARQGKLI